MKKLYGLVLILGLALVLAACGGSGDEKKSSDENTSGDSKKEEASEGMVPDTLVIGFVPSQDSDNIADTVEPLANRLGEELDIEVKSQVMTDYNALVEAMGANQVHVGFIPAFGYVLANEQYDVEVILKSIRYGSGTYKAQYVVRADSGIESLEDLRGKVWAYADQGSTSGYLFPANQLMEEFDIATTAELETDFFNGTRQAGGHDNAAILVYEGDADVATTFDDVRTELEEEYPDIMEKLKVLTYTEDIPNDTISVTKELDKEFVQKIKDTFLSFNDDEDMIQIMNDVYNWDAIDEAKDEEYQVVKDTYAKFKDSVGF
ncbi:phosphate/phosphite/phosphonate ABC transporter substrate-binding protein [Ornithinibacillus sp. BX22]|uniref:Phosphate/phosphite/phosphonate ABC transporter substrate-binding protein n=2 Tax=Ornithinibacillus TaxID=484508 RepID=A0A923L5X1_9BACI|nr:MULTISPECIES: phosphate/phosphite/phosphonate ABC transporter substrate-binding protein [Ornithinibacillus]MBC5636970.1 phosphate/phosphite/phosphonate ABC transporter substrate-binding protein [Ornithinibacillus hominis]MBS3681536.1 phosphate/phosphite/phosphonate ABC transporter substrate-binding protein [Ornithinibacillus massiliensis]